MAKLSDMTASPIKHICIFGPPKTGKTELAGKLAEFKKLLWFDLEKGVGTLFKLPKEWQENIEVIQIPDTRSSPMAIETMLKVIKGLPVKICHEHGKVSCPLCIKDAKPVTEVALNTLGPDWCVVVDSTTQLTNSGVANITRNQPDDYKLQRDDWGHLQKIMDMFFSHVQAAPYNVICIAHETIVETTAGSEKIVPTAGSSNFARNFAKYFDEVIYCEVKNKKHVFASATTYANNILTGGRSGFAIESAAEPKLIDLWK